MAYTIELSETAEKGLSRLPKDVQRRVAEALPVIAANPLQRKARKLVGHADLYRWRVGNYRIVYHVYQERVHVLVIRIGHRSYVYRAL